MPMPAALSRTSSASSTFTNASSEDLYATFISESLDSSSRRTRKRFTNAQLRILEQLYHQNSHPSREQRETVARTAGMEVKSVTIWLQNKRQTDRRTILASGRVPPPVIIQQYHRVPSPSTASSTSTKSRRPSLDSVASRSELGGLGPRTPSRRRDPHAALWETMESSPVGPQFSPPTTRDSDFVEFGKHTRTLEWACARKRLARKAEREERRANPGLMTDDEDTDIEPTEAVTPPSTWGENDPRWNSGGHTLDKKGDGIQRKEVEIVRVATPTLTPLPTIPEPDDDTMKAALALCGLMQG
ncbi:Homeobox domain-containing protein [Mycena indigotica]|uniref:Homeobox domain-containing protein n=1 Tax=Mycena indigotica TaxID=2126181 RepID=A0A8H6SRL5_9AGAR|nr:Homeobox domain-containing protein [Mycena indigotica]KAF7303765.1 Homeobox domain-containing protein [Mycena indigotica]